MSLPFSATTRAFTGQGPRLSALTWLLGAGLGLSWVVWLFWAPITQSVSGEVIATTPQGLVQAQFTQALPKPLYPGQPAFLRLEAPALGTLPLVVARPSTTATAQVIDFYLVGALPAELAQLPLHGQVEIEIERISPLQWFGRKLWGMVAPP